MTILKYENEPHTLPDTPSKEEIIMETIVTNLINLPVYSDKGIYLGKVKNVRLDVENAVIDALCLGETNKFIIKDQRNISFPYKWIQAIGDIVVLKFFPDRIVVKRRDIGPATESAH